MINCERHQGCLKQEEPRWFGNRHVEGAWETLAKPGGAKAFCVEVVEPRLRCPERNIAHDHPINRSAVAVYNYLFMNTSVESMSWCLRIHDESHSALFFFFFFFFGTCNFSK